MILRKLCLAVIFVVFSLHAFTKNSEISNSFYNFSNSEYKVQETESFQIGVIRNNSSYQDSAIKEVNIEVKTGTPIHILKIGDEKKLKLVFKNESDRPVFFNAEINIEHYYGETISFSKKFKLNIGESQECKIPKSPNKRGIWWIKYILTDLEVKNRSSNGQISFVYMKPAGPTSEPNNEFLFSICTHTERYDIQDQQLEALATSYCGAKVVRTGQTWASIQPTCDTWKWDGLDHIVDIYGKLGVEIQYLLAYCPKWAAPVEKQHSKDSKDWSRSVPNIESYGRYAYEAAKRYKGRINYWEVWNEPDIGFFRGSLDEYLSMLAVAYKSIKKASPKAKVLTGGFACMKHREMKEDFQKQVLIKGKENFDIHAFHKHGPFLDYANTIDGSFMQMRKDAKVTQPWYSNETAISSMDGAEKMQAETLFKKFLFAWSRGAIGYTWYDLRNDGYNPKNAEHNFGLITHDFYPKAAYPTYNTLSLFLKKTTFDRQLELGSNLWAFVFKGNDRIVIPAWNEKKSSAGEHMVIKTDAKKAEKIDLMGNVTPVPIVDGMVILNVTSEPEMLNLLHATKVSLIKSIIDINNTQIAVAGGSVSYPVVFKNPFDSPKTFNLSFKLSKGLNMDLSDRSITIGAAQEKTEIFKLDISSNINNYNDKKTEFKISYKIEGTQWNETINIPVNLATLIPSGDFNRPADFILNNRKNVVTLCGGDPSMANLIWKDANDLSASIWLGHDENNLLLKIDVTDDIYNQKFHGVRVWKGDNVQSALKVPEQDGIWQFGFTLMPDNSSEVYIWSAPSKYNKDQVAKSIHLMSNRKDNVTHYLVAIPLDKIGISLHTLNKGIRFNLLVNDSDERSREGWIRIAPGIGIYIYSEEYPFVIFK